MFFHFFSEAQYSCDTLATVNHLVSEKEFSESPACRSCLIFNGSHKNLEIDLRSPLQGICFIYLMLKPPCSRIRLAYHSPRPARQRARTQFHDRHGS